MTLTKRNICLRLFLFQLMFYALRMSSLGNFKMCMCFDSLEFNKIQHIAKIVDDNVLAFMKRKKNAKLSCMSYERDLFSGLVLLSKSTKRMGKKPGIQQCLQ
ncbi:hypothetical protein R6Q59_034868 [Mikania micrantha]